MLNHKFLFYAFFNIGFRLSMFLAGAFLLTFCSCTKDEDVATPFSGFESQKDHLLISGEDYDLRLNPIGDSHWLSGDVVINGERTLLPGIQFSVENFHQVSSIRNNEQEVIIKHPEWVMVYSDFQLTKKNLTFQVSDDLGNNLTYSWESRLMKFDSDLPLSNQFAQLITSTLTSDHFLADEAQPHKLLWPCVVGAGTAAWAAYVAHYNNVIATVANNYNACVSASFCSASCVSCPPEQ